MIKEISIQEANKFYSSVPGKYKKQLYFPNHGNFYGVLENEVIKGIICILPFKNKNRITCFLIDNDSRDKGYGTDLLKYVKKISGKKTLTAFATVASRDIFLENDFKILNVKNDITFVECDLSVKL